MAVSPNVLPTLGWEPAGPRSWRHDRYGQATFGEWEAVTIEQRRGGGDGPRRARSCGCVGPVELEAGWCSKCGRLLERLEG